MPPSAAIQNRLDGGGVNAKFSSDIAMRQSAPSQLANCVDIRRFQFRDDAGFALKNSPVPAGVRNVFHLRAPSQMVGVYAPKVPVSASVPRNVLLRRGITFRQR